MNDAAIDFAGAIFGDKKVYFYDDDYINDPTEKAKKIIEWKKIKTGGLADNIVTDTTILYDSPNKVID